MALLGVTTTKTPPAASIEISISDVNHQSPASHGDSNTDDDSSFGLNQNIIEGSATTVCTRSDDSELQGIMREGISRWNNALRPHIGFAPFEESTTADCADTDIEVTWSTLHLQDDEYTITSPRQR